MRRSLSIPIAFAVAMVCSQSTGLAQEKKNAATWYNRALERANSLSDAEWELVRAYAANPSGTPSPMMREVLSRAGPILNLVRQGSLQDSADFNLDYSRGYEMVLPHLPTLLNRISPLMRADAAMRLHDGDTSGAADRLASMYRLAEHFNSDRTVISPLVGRRVLSLADEAAQMGFDQAAFSARDAEVMLRAVQRLSGPDPFNLMEGIVGEQEIGVTWLSDTLGTQEQRLNGVGWAAFLTESDEDAQRIVAMSDEEFAESLSQYDGLLDRVVGAFSMEDRAAGREEIGRIEAAVENGEFGVLAGAMQPWFIRIFDQMVESEEQIASRIAMLSGLVTGEIKPEDEANAAFLYARAIEEMRRIPPPEFQAVCDFDAGTMTAIDEPLAATLAHALPIVDLLREASLKRRCDFAVLRPDDAPVLCHDYVAGMHDVFRLLRVDAARLLRTGETDAAVDRLALSYRAVGHLATDDSLLCAVVSHASFERMDRIIAGALAADTFTDEHRRILLKASMQIGKADPFGYIGSVMAARMRFSDPLRKKLRRSTQEERDQLELGIEAIEMWTGDQLLYVLAIYDTMARATDKSPAPDQKLLPDPILRLDDVLALPELEQVRNDVALIAPLLARDEYDLFRTRMIPRYARTDERMRSARSDLRRGLTRLRFRDPAFDPETENQR